MLKMSIQITGADEIVKLLDDVAAKVKDFTPAWNEIRADFYELMAVQFAIGGRTPWQPLTEQYARWKARVAPGQPIMVLTGAMRDSLTSSSANGSVLSMTPMQMEIGTATASKRGYKYPYAHQKGLGNNPVRKVIDLPLNTASRWATILNNHVMFTVARNDPSAWQAVTMADFGFEGEL